MVNYLASDASTSMVGGSSSSSVEPMTSSLICARLTGPAVLSFESIARSMMLFLLLFTALSVPRIAGMVGHVVCARKYVWMETPGTSHSPIYIKLVRVCLAFA